MTTPELRALLEGASGLVVEAGRNALGRWGSVGAECKADATLVTAVDRENEEFLAKSLVRLLPGSRFAGEEGGIRSGPEQPGHVPTAEDVWVCDPIDGTTNYVMGLPHWCVAIGLLRNGRAELGAVYAPVLDRLYTAARGQGVWCNGVPIRSTGAAEVEHEDLLCLSTGALRALHMPNLICRIRCLGSIALEVCLAAEGRAIGAVGLGEGIVDLAGAMCICDEAGCSVAYLDGRSVDPTELLTQWRTREPFIAAPSRLQNKLSAGLVPIPHV